jgi:hypothetical protein
MVKFLVTHPELSKNADPVVMHNLYSVIFNNAVNLIVAIASKINNSGVSRVHFS